MPRHLRTTASTFLAVHRRLLGVEAISPAEHVAESIREKASVREWEENRLPGPWRSITQP